MIEQTLYSTLAPLVAGRVFPDEAPFDTPRPFATYVQVGGQAHVYGDGELANLRNARMQIDVWAATRSQATQLALQIESALTQQGAFTAAPLGAFTALREPDLGLYGARQDFSISAPR